jgi:light-regulated signal transduction histidine kinase (bacteriophytochrome)
VIEFFARKSKGRLAVRRQANGIGFDQKYAERVLDFFRRLGETDVPGGGAAFLFTLRGGEERQ